MKGFGKTAAITVCGAWCALAMMKNANAQSASTRAPDAPDVAVMGTLDRLMLPRDGRALAYTSHDRQGGNIDFRPIAAGETTTLMDHVGAGVVRRFWIVVPGDARALRQVILRCYWDDETAPSVEVPLMEFFGGSFGEWRAYTSLPMNMTSGGSNCYWPMPFRRHARITLENRGKAPLPYLYYNISMETAPQLPRATLYFHAQFRRQKPTRRGQPVTLLEATGRGHYVGSLVAMQPLVGRSLSYLEGDEQAWVDGEKTPSINGTGTEDYFGGAYYFATGEYSAPYHGAPRKDEATGRVAAYRWHIEDPIPFTKSLRFTLEHGGENDAPYMDYTTVAYWYQSHPHAPFPPLPTDLMPSEPRPVFKIGGLVEGEDLLPNARATEGELAAQDLTPFIFADNADFTAELPASKRWSGFAHLFWQPKKVGAKLTLHVAAPESKTYGLAAYFTRAPDYGDLRLGVNGAPVGEVFKAYSPKVAPSGSVSFGRVPLRAGDNEITLEVVGKDERSSGFFAGLDGFSLQP